MDTSHFLLETEHLLLQSITLEFKDDIFREFTSEITTYMTPRPAKNISETIAFIEQSMAGNRAGRNLQVVILNKETKEFLGCGGLHHVDSKTPELGIWVKKAAHGHGYGKETMLALKKWADHNLSYDYIVYPVDRDNYASRRIPEAMGGKVVKEYDEVNQSGRTLHTLEYHIYSSLKQDE